MSWLNKEKLLEIFEDVLTNWKVAQDYVIQDTHLDCCDGYSHEDLEGEIQEYRNKFIEYLNN